MKGFDWKRVLSRLTDGSMLSQGMTAARTLFGAAPRPKSPVEVLDESSKPKRPKGRPPKFLTAEPVVLRDLTPRELVQRNILIFVAGTMAMFLANIFVFSHIQHASTQAQLRTSFTEKLALATAPTSEGDENLILLADGTPVALLEIPDLGVSEIVVEGTDSTALRSGPGHRRDTVLPGQSGTSVIMGRASAFGGPFAAIHTLQPGTLFSVVTGQGQHIYKVIGMRYAGEPEPAPAAEGVSRIVLETGRGLPYSPSGVTRVDAQMIATSTTYSSADNLTGLGVPCVPITPSSTPSGGPSASPSPGQGAQATEPCVTPAKQSPSPAASMSPGANIGETPQPVGEPTSEIATGSATFNNSVQAYAAGARLTSTQTLPLEHRVLASDVTTVWALVFALQFLLLAEIGVVWGVRRFGLRKAWVAGIPIILLASLLASDQLIRLLPNLT
jgi:sortase (surface protein transpeptidase)